MKNTRATIMFLFLLSMQGIFAQTAEIGNMVWEDLDGDGIQDAAEPGIPDATVTLVGTDELGNPVSLTTTTNSSGLYIFTSLEPGTYNLTFDTPAGGYLLTVQNQGSDGSIGSDPAPGTQQTANTVLSPNESDLTWDAGFYKNANMKNFVWNDLNANGLQDGGEAGIPSILVTLTGTSGDGNSITLTQTSNANGDVSFDNLSPGTYKTTFSYPVGCQTASPKDQGSDDNLDSDINPITLLTKNEVLTSGEINDKYDAGFYEGTVLNLVGSQCGPGEIAVNIGSSIHPPIHYEWSNSTGGSGSGDVGQQSFSLTGLTNDTYSVTTTDALGCSASASTTVFVTPEMILNLVPSPTNCFGGLDGSIAMTVTGGVGPFTFLWSNGSVQCDVVGINQGTYTVTVTDSQNCTKTASGTVTQASLIMLSTVVVNNVCFGGSIGTVNLSVSGGTPGYNFTWSDGQITEDLVNAGSHTYTVTVTDSHSCTKTVSVTISSPPAIVVSQVVSNVLCRGGNNGAIDVSVSGGTPGYTYLWSNGNTTQDRANLIVGTYTVTVTDANGCTKSISATITEPPNLLLSRFVTSVLCNGANTGTIDLTVTGGTPGYTYLWANGATTQDLNSLVAGTYTVTVTDANGCTKTISATVNQPASIIVSMSSSNVLCQGGTDGNIDITVSSGVPGYTYNWSNSATTQDLTNLAAGVYTVTVTDSQNCTKTLSATITEPSAISLNTMVTLVPCGSATNDGAIDLTASGGTAPFVYVWSNGFTTQDISNLSPGNYSITVTDSNFCSAVLTESVAIGSSIPASDFSITNTSCSPIATDGAITITTLPPSAQAPLSFAWQGPNGFSSTLQDISDLAAGDYSCTISDAIGCSFFADLSVGKTPSDMILELTATNVICFGGADGAIELTVTGGSAAYTYLWSNGAVTQDPSNLAAGTYSVTVTDANSCQQSNSVTIAQPTDILLTSTVQNIFCNASSTGSINLTANGGIAPYSYVWSNSSTTQDLVGLAAGTYTVTVTDSNACTKTISSTITQPSAISIITNVTNIPCIGFPGGTIDVTVNGGVPPYTYNWAGGITTQDRTNLSPGTYIITITDSNFCTKTASATITTEAQPNFSITSLSNNCNSEILIGSTLPNLTYNWTGPNGFTANSQAITALNSGVYSLTITNSSGCTASANYSVFILGNGSCGRIKGLVVQDIVENCLVDLSEPGLAGWLVRAEGVDTFYGVTKATGEYYVAAPVGSYTMKVLEPNGLWQVCAGSITANLTMPDDTVFGGDFPVKLLFQCPSLSVNIGTSQLRRCIGINQYYVEYCNEGTVPAEDAYVLVTLDPFLTFLSSSHPWSGAGNQIYRFNVGDLEVGECGIFFINVKVNCDAVLGQTHCTEAHIYPDTLCTSTDLNWSGASLEVRSICNSDSLRFLIKNVGNGDMNSTLNYIVVEDAVMFMSAPLPLLPAGDSIIIGVPANGSTWYLEVGQEAFHPEPSPPSLAVEGCTTSPTFSLGYVNQFELNDQSQNVDIDCTSNIGSNDPNDKYGYPLGYGVDHYIHPGTDIEYIIRFQNNGTDTAFTVRIIDTLSIWLDPASIRFGVSSHPYRYDLCGEGIVHFIFDDILLPDSTTNEVASHGFAKFNIKPRPDAPLETQIENTAAIYFDLNDPVITNTSRHRLGEKFISVGIWQPSLPDAEICVIPNPFSNQALLTVKGLQHYSGLRLQIFDMQGNVVREMSSENEIFRLTKGDWPAGIYLFKITQQGKLVGSGKLVAE